MQVLVMAPFRRDETVLAEVLQTEALEVEPLRRETLIDLDPSQVGALVLTQDAIDRRLVTLLGRFLERQEPWSELPLVVLMDADYQTSRTLAWFTSHLPRTRPVMLQRPTRPAALTTAVLASLAARRRQFEVRDHLLWHDELRLEMNHRVKNVLANALAIFHMARRHSADVKELTGTYEERLLALTRAHSALLRGADPHELTIVARTSVDPYDPERERITLDGPMLMLKPSAAVTLALCFYELAANAAAHGALNRAEGTVRLTWRIAADRLEIVWRERPGVRPTGTRERGYGLNFIEAAASRGLRGECAISFDGGEYVCSLNAPLSVVAPATTGTSDVQ